MDNNKDAIIRVFEYAKNIKRERSPSIDDSDSKLIKLKKKLKKCLLQIEEQEIKQVREREWRQEWRQAQEWRQEQERRQVQEWRREQEQRREQQEQRREQERRQERRQEQEFIDKIKIVSNYYNAIKPFYKDFNSIKFVSNNYAVKYFKQCGECKKKFENKTKYRPHLQVDGKLLIADRKCEIICHGCVYNLANSKFGGNFGKTCMYYRLYF